MPFSSRPEWIEAWKAQRQIEHMFEIDAHGREPAAVRQPVGAQADEDRADDREQRKADPGADQRQRARGGRAL